MLGCDRCPFKTKRIGSKGPKDSRFVIVGESPGGRELAVGRPFVGPSGQMLDQVLAEAGLNDLNVTPYVTNALSCFPANKDIPKMKAATHSCQQRLLDEITAHPRDVILCLGAAAAWAVTGNWDLKITQDRGKILPSPLACKGVVLAVHPAFLMRNGGGLPFWKKDLKKAVDLLAGNKIDDLWQEPEYQVINNRQELEQLLWRYQKAERITADTETDSFNYKTGRILCATLTMGDGSLVDVIPEEVIYENQDLIRKLAELPGKWTWQNGKFDIHWYWEFGAMMRVDEDTMLLSYALNENRGFHDLDQVAANWINAPQHKKMLDQYLPNKQSSYRVIPKDVLYKYAAIDTSKTHKMWVPLREEVNKDPKTKSLYEKILLPAVPFLARTEAYGVLVDMQKVEAHDKEHVKLLEEIGDKIQVYAEKHVGRRINLNSPKQMQELLYDKMGLGRKGSSTDEKSLIQIQRNFNHPIANHILDYREVAKRHGTYIKSIPPLIDPDGRIRTTYLIHGTATGRLASRDPNILNVPRGPMVRSQFVAKPGHIFVEVDLNQAELRSLALMSNDPLLIEIYTKNEISIHDVTTEKFYASKKELITNEAVRRRVMAQLQMHSDVPPDLIYKEAKMRGKAVNFGIVYGRTSHSLAQEFNIKVGEAQRWIDTWFETYSGAAAFISKCRSAPLSRKTITTVFGRRKRHGVVNPERLQALQNESANFPHQSTASDIMLLASIEVEPRLLEEWDAHPWNEVYDAIYYEVEADEDKVRESIKYVQEVISRVPRDWGLTRIPFIGDAKVGFDWGNMYDYVPGKDTLASIFPDFEQRAIVRAA